MKSRFGILWTIWTLFGAALVYGISSSDPKNTLVSIIANMLSLSPLLGLMLTLGSVQAASQFNAWLQSEKNSHAYVAGGISILFMLPGLLTLRFDPYLAAIFSVLTFAVLGALKQLKNKEFTLTWTDLLIWFILWIPFDLRWYMDMLPAGSDSYTWFSAAISVIAVIGWNGYRGAEIGYNLVPKLKDIRVVLLSLLIIMAFVLPPGLLTGFLTFSMPQSYNVPKMILQFVGIFLTIALPEELFFRGILLGGLDKIFSKKWIPMVISSLAFGLMHWNNVHALSTQITYVSLAAVAGVGYGWAYRKSGNNILAAILVHTLVDWIWKIFLTT